MYRRGLKSCGKNFGKSRGNQSETLLWTREIFSDQIKGLNSIWLLDAGIFILNFHQFKPLGLLGCQ